jgi:CRP/FNR family transcriptional regulator
MIRFKGVRMMSLSNYFPIWDKLRPAEKKLLENAATKRAAPKGTLLHNGSADCVGLFVVRSGQLRAFILSEEGKEITLYRLFERDICLFSASCMLSSIQFEIMVEAEKDTELWVIPTEGYRRLMEDSAVVSNYTNQIMASRFSDVMWLMDQILFKSFDRRLSQFLLEESGIEGTDSLKITHERIANHMGTAREVVTRMLKYLQSEGIVSLSRGEIRIEDRIKLQERSA